MTFKIVDIPTYPQRKFIRTEHELQHDQLISSGIIREKKNKLFITGKLLIFVDISGLQ